MHIIIYIYYIKITKKTINHLFCDPRIVNKNVFKLLKYFLIENIFFSIHFLFNWKCIQRI